MQRRAILKSLTAIPVFGSLGASATWSLGIEPLVRPKPGQLRLALAAYSMRKYLAIEKDGSQAMNLFDFVDYCRSLGVDGAELTSYYFREDVSDAELAKLKLHAQRSGVTISGGAIRNDFCLPSGPALDADIAHAKKWIDRYALLGVATIRIFAGKLPKGAELEPTLKHCAEVTQQVSEYAASRGIILALENHGGVTATADGLLGIVKQVESEALAINFDSANFKSSADPYAELAAIAPYAVNAQIKVEIFPNGKREEADLERILNILREAGYSGWVALEYEAAEEPKVAIPRWIDKLKKIVA